MDMVFDDNPMEKKQQQKLGFMKTYTEKAVHWWWYTLLHLVPEGSSPSVCL